LQVAEEAYLAKKVREHGDREAAHHIISSHLRIVISIASKYSGYGISLGELVAEGNIGLMQAVERFEPVHVLLFIRKLLSGACGRDLSRLPERFPGSARVAACPAEPTIQMASIRFAGGLQEVGKGEFTAWSAHRLGAGLSANTAAQQAIWSAPR
jgi:hypothetical protein